MQILMRRKKKMESKFQVEHPSSLLQNDVIQCIDKVQLEDQENDKIAKPWQNKKVFQHEHKNLMDMHYKEVLEKDEEKLLAQVKKTKVTKKELKKHLSEEEEETLRLKNLNKNLLEQIRNLKDEKRKSQNTENKVDKSEIIELLRLRNHNELLRLRNHNESLLTQIKKLKNDKKALKDKLEQFTQEEVSKSPVVTVQVEDKGTNTDPVNMTTQEDKSVEETTHLDVAVRMINIPSEGFVTNSITSSPEVNQKISPHLIRECQTKKVPYRHPNHESRQLNHATYWDHLEQRQQTDVPEKSDVTSIQSYDDKSLHNSSDQNITQNINLGWSDSFLVQQFCFT